MEHYNAAFVTHLATDIGKSVGVEVQLDETVPPDNAALLSVDKHRFAAETPRNARETNLSKQNKKESPTQNTGGRHGQENADAAWHRKASQ